MEYDTLMGCLELLRGTGGVHDKGTDRYSDILIH